MENLLLQIGLTEPQAKIYLNLVDAGRSAPPAIAEATKFSRTNTYKVLEKLEIMGLIDSQMVNKKLVYEARDPSSLNSLLAIERNRVISLEKSISTAMQNLRNRHQKSITSSKVIQARGKKSLIESYAGQINGDNSPIYFIKSRDDIAFMGYDNMDKIRRLATKKGHLRFGITPDTPESFINPEVDVQTNLVRTWIKDDEYNQPVEWSVNNKELLITIFESDGRSIAIKDPVVAKAFQQIWKLLDKKIKESPLAGDLPIKASRLV